MEVDPRFHTYISNRLQAHEVAVAELFEGFTPRERLLIKEAAVIGFVEGVRSRKATVDIGDREILYRALNGALGAADLYPTLTGHEDEADEGEDDD